MPQDSASSEGGEPAQGLTLAPSVTVNSGATSTDASSAAPPVGAPHPQSSRSSTRRQIRFTSLAVVAVLVVLVLVVAAYVFTGGFHLAKGPSGTEGIILLPSGSSYSIMNGQFSDVAFHINSTSTIQGKLNSSEGVDIYVMTPTEFVHLSITLNLSGYEWTSGAVADQEVYNLDVSVPAGGWFLAFLDPNASFPTGVSFYSDLTLTEG